MSGKAFGAEGENARAEEASANRNGDQQRAESGQSGAEADNAETATPVPIPSIRIPTLSSPGSALAPMDSQFLDLLHQSQGFFPTQSMGIGFGTFPPHFMPPFPGPSYPRGTKTRQIGPFVFL